MGTGKSAVGSALAEALGVPFVDMDDELARRHGPIETQFARDGEARFRERERQLVRELADGAPRVVATGGGAWVCPDNREVLEASYRTVCLTAPLEILRRRVGDGDGRPLWNHEVENRYRARQAAYSEAALQIDVGQLSIAEVVDDILEALR